MYKTKQERDNALQKEIKEIEAERKKHTEQLKALNKETDQIKKQIETVVKEMKKKTAAQQSQRTEIDSAQSSYMATKTQRDTAANIRKYTSFPFILLASFALSILCLHWWPKNILGNSGKRKTISKTS